jgi:transposase
MIQVTPHMRILVCIDAVDFRKGIDGLVSRCRNELDEDPFRGTVFVFRNRRRTAVKILAYDGQGFWLCQKRLSNGRFDWWPSAQNSVTGLAAHQLQVLLSGGDPLATKAAPLWRPLVAAGSA